MHRLSTIAFIGMLALTMAGCGSGSEENSATPSPRQVYSKPFEKPPMVRLKTRLVQLPLFLD